MLEILLIVVYNKEKCLEVMYLEPIFDELYEKLYETDLRTFAKNPCGRKTAEKVREIAETESALQRIVPVEERDTLEKYTCLQHELSEIEKIDVFAVAFSLGLRIGISVFGKSVCTAFTTE